jgi:hypothetical protein
MSVNLDPDALHRLVKQSLDSGVASSIEDAERLFLGYRLAVAIDSTEASSFAGQAALLTVVALGRRVFLGGVEVAGPLNQQLALPLPFAGSNLRDAVVELGGRVVALDDTTRVPLVTIGQTANSPNDREFHIRAIYAGWRGGIVPADFETPDAASPMRLSPMLAAAIAVNEAFLYIRGETPEAGRRAVGLSLWRPAPNHSWLEVDVTEPELRLLPSRLWLIGLGHLGQAYLWALGILPYAADHPVELVLQDIDSITRSTESTSILTDGTLEGEKKTRAMAAWAKRRGFPTWIHERRFTDKFVREEDEPAVALCGLDNGLGRRALDGAGFDLVVEAGLGRGYRDFRTVRLHTLPSSRSAAEIWPERGAEEAPVDRPAYAALLDKGVLDRCGVTLLAGKAVGAPFVGSFAATLVISELLRHLHGGSLTQLLDVDLLSVEHRVVVLQKHDFSAFNPGYVEIPL